MQRVKYWCLLDPEKYDFEAEQRVCLSDPKIDHWLSSF